MILTVFDTETTGLNPDRHEIIEVGLLSVLFDRSGEWHVLKQYESKVKPENLHTANAKALEINGYSEEAWKDAKPFSAVVEEIRSFVEGSDVCLGQNLIFDMRFVDEMCKRANIECPDFPSYIDTKSIADRLVEANWLKRSRMDYLVEHYGVNVAGRAHTALVDCWRTLRVWEHLLKDCGEEYSLYTFDEPYEARRKSR